MGVLTYNETSGLGYADVIVAAVGSLANAGASIYQTVEMSKATKGQQKLQKAAIDLERARWEKEAELVAEENRRRMEGRGELIEQGMTVGAVVVFGLGALWLAGKVFGGGRRKTRGR